MAQTKTPPTTSAQASATPCSAGTGTRQVATAPMPITSVNSGAATTLARGATSETRENADAVSGSVTSCAASDTTITSRRSSRTW